jgi:hypothetical protein
MPKHYADRWRENKVPKAKNVVGIDGGRAIEGRRMRVEFDGAAVDMAGGVENMAGYFLVAWDDEGNFTSSLSLGPRNPYPTMDVPDKILQMARADIIKDDE